MSQPSKPLEYGRPIPNRNKRIWVAVISIVAGIACGPLGVLWAELNYYGGLSSSPMAIILFPFGMMTGYVTLGDMALVLVQFPIYGIVLGALIVPQIHLGSLYIAPEQAVVLANVVAYVMSPSPRFMLQLKRKTRLSPDIMDFAFVPSAKVAFQPGQYLECTLTHTSADSRGNRRFFTIASSPTENAIHLGVRFYPKGSSYKRALQSLGVRGSLQGTQIAGDFTLPADSTRKLVFIAGGIGITPYRSMLKYLADTHQRRDIVVLYAGKTPADFVYRDVLTDAEAKLGARIIYTLTDITNVPRNWTGGVGRIDEQMIQRMIPDFQQRTFYLSGPPDMVHAHEAALRRLGVPGRQLKKDAFPGLV